MEKLSDHEVWNERYIVVFILLEGTEAFGKVLALFVLKTWEDSCSMRDETGILRSG